MSRSMQKLYTSSILLNEAPQSCPRLPFHGQQVNMFDEMFSDLTLIFYSTLLLATGKVFSVAKYVTAHSLP